MKPFKKLYRLIFAAIFIFLIQSNNYAAEKVNFSGNWAFNESASQTGEFRRADKAIVVKQDVNTIIIERTMLDREGNERTVSSAITLDGKECINKDNQNRERKSTAVWSDDGKVLTITTTMTFERDGQSSTITNVEKWSLSEDSKLIIDVNSQSPRGNRTAKLVYDKK
jgi:hypothetical protein